MALHRWHWRISQCSALFQHAQCFTLVMEYLPRELWNLQPIQRYGLWFMVFTWWSYTSTVIIFGTRELICNFLLSGYLFHPHQSTWHCSPLWCWREIWNWQSQGENKKKKNRPEHTFNVKLIIISKFGFTLLQGWLKLAAMLKLSSV